MAEIVYDFKGSEEFQEEKRNVRGYLLLASYLSGLNFFATFKACRDSIDLI